MSPPASPGPLVEVRQLGKVFVDGVREVRVLDGLDLDLASGERVAVVGPSGVGKSTLLHVLGTLERPTAGELRFAGRDLLTLGGRELACFRNQEIGFVFQFHHLLPDFSALENVMMPALIARWPSSKARSEAQALLERVGLAARTTHRPGELSGGERQRVAVARAVMLRPRLLLADEPTGNLDPESGMEVERLLVELNREFGMALLVVTHEEGLFSAMHRTLRLRGGRLT